MTLGIKVALNLNTSTTKLGHNVHEHKIPDEFDYMGQFIPDQSLLSVLEIEKMNFSCLFGIYLHR